MQKLAIVWLTFLIISCSQTRQDKKEWALAIHGGAGNMDKAAFSEEDIQKYELGLNEALELGISLLEQGYNSLDVVEQVVRKLEDNPLFNAGKGAVFTNHGRNELDAAIMDGRDLNAGAVAGVGDNRNPISAARLVME